MFLSFWSSIQKKWQKKRNAIAYLEKKLIPVANSVIYLDQKHNESRVDAVA